jgi:ribosomal protein S18 acetylase RimI-like enzyme
MHPPHIRVADARDNDAIIDLSLRAWRPVFESYKPIWGRPLFERFYPDWAARQASDVANALNTNPTWVVAADDTVAGFVNVTFDDQTLTGEIYMIAIDPDHQHRGLGSLLTQHALSQMRARGMTLAIVSTGGDPGHGPARATYERNGFIPFPQVLYSMLLQTNLD